MTGKTPEERIADLGLTLPAPARAVANYVPWVITGNLVMTSGNLPWRDGKLAYVGQIGRELSGDDGYKSCQLSCLNALAQIKEAVEELFHVKVEGVRTQIREGKKRRFRQSMGQLPTWKKAIVTLSTEDKIEFF